MRKPTLHRTLRRPEHPSDRVGPPSSGWALTALLLLLPGPLQSQVWEAYNFRELEFRGIGVEAARVWPARVEPANAFGLRLDLGLVDDRLRVAPSARFWASTLKTEEVIRLADQIVLVCERQVGVACPAELDLGEVKLSDLELSVDAHYLLRPNRILTPFVGPSISLHLLNGRGDFIDGTFVEDLLDTVSPGLGALGGVIIHLASAFIVTAEARLMLASDLRYAGVGLGGVWTLPAPGADIEDSIFRRRRR